MSLRASCDVDPDAPAGPDATSVWTSANRLQQPKTGLITTEGFENTVFVTRGAYGC